jgi:hypothetical protein
MILLYQPCNLRATLMTQITGAAAGGAMHFGPPLAFDVKRGMYGTCTRINGRIGLGGDVFAQAFFWDIPQKWDIEIFNGSIREYSVDVFDREQAIEQVEAIMSLEYSRNFARRTA